jgi:hypothetical protein
MFLTMSVISHWYYDAACGTEQSIMYIVTSVGGGGECDLGQREKLERFFCQTNNFETGA